jgi:hydroxyacylglutathione hydrolase
VYGADARIPEINYVCKDHEEFKLGSLDVTPLHTPCHTKGHVCYYVSDPNTGEKAVFTGDTLFIGGVGNFFEGDARDMYRILFHVIMKLPDETWVYCGHEYTRANLKVIILILSLNAYINLVCFKC